MEVIINTLTIKNDYEFRRVYKKGKSFVNAAVIIYILKNKRKINRIGITTSKKIGNAVLRNRARRIIRAAFSQYEDKLQVGYDFIFVARSRTYSLKTQNLAAVMGKVFSSAKLVKPEDKNGIAK